MRRIACATAVIAVAMSACTVGPDYRLPAQAKLNDAAARGSFVGAQGPALSSEALPPQWWRLYRDPVLDALVQRALQANTDLRVAEAQLQRSHALLEEVRTLREPEADFAGGLEYGQLAGEQYLLPVRPPRNTFYDAGLTIGYNLDLFGAVRRGIEAASADDAAVTAARDRVRVNVAAETARAYAAVCSAGLQLAAVGHSLELQRESLQFTQRLFSGGRAIDLDVTRSSQQLAELSGMMPPLEAAQANALFRLAVLTGQLPTQLDASLMQCAAPARLRQPLPVGDGAALLRRRPDVRESERALAAATAQIGVETAQLYPTVELGLPLGSVGARKDFLTAPTNYWTAGGMVSWQANRSATRARIKAANAGADLALARFDGVVLTAVSEVESALSVYTHDLDREASVRTALEQADKAAAQAQQLQRLGRINALALLDAQRVQAAAALNLAQIESALATDQVAVFLALGGGWEPAQS